MKKIFLMTLVLSCAIMFMACGDKGSKQDVETTAKNAETKDIETKVDNKEESSMEAPTVGGWDNNNDSSPSENKEAMEAFDNATKDLDGYTYEVIAVLGSQPVAGTNYSYLCKGQVVAADVKPEYLIVNVYEDLEKNAEITAMVPPMENMDGWSYNEGSTALSDNKDVETAFNKAIEKLTGVSYEPIAYIAKSDSQYAVFTKATTAAQNAKKSFVVMYINSDGTLASGDGNDIEDVDIGIDIGAETVPAKE